MTDSELLPRCAVFWLLVLGALFPLPVHGQDGASAPAAAAERLSGVLAAVENGSLVRVTTASYQLEDAQIDGVGDGAVTLSNEDLSIDVPFADIRGVAVRDSHWLQGTLWGAASGAVLGSVVGVMIGSWGCVTPAECTDGENRGGVVGGILGGAAGGLGGFVIGRHSLYWRPIFP